MTVARSTHGLRGGPAGDPGLGALAQVLRWAHAVALPELEHQLPPAPTTDQGHVDLFAAWLAGQGAPAPVAR